MVLYVPVARSSSGYQKSIYTLILFPTTIDEKEREKQVLCKFLI